MQLTYILREILGRKKQTALIAVFVGLAVALVVLVTALSSGVKDAQEQVLSSVYGVGTDITVTATVTEPTQDESGSSSSEGPGQRFDFGEGGSDEGGATTDGDTQNLSSSRLSLAMGSSAFDSSTLDTVSGISGVAETTGVLTLQNISFSGEIPTQSDSSSSTDASTPAMPSGNAGGSGGGFGGGSFNVNQFTVTGVDFSQTDVGPLSSLTVSDGALPTENGETTDAVVTSSYATSASLAVGDTITIGGTDFTIVALVDSTSTSTDSTSVYIPLAEAQSLSDESDQLSSVYVKAASANDVSSLKSSIQDALGDDLTVNTQEDLASTVSGSLSTASSLISKLGTWLSIGVLAAAVLFTVLFTIGGVSRRTREFGTLKAIGWSSRRISMQVAGESLIQTVAGGLIGLVLALAGIAIINAAGITLDGSTTSATGFGGTGGFGGGGNTGGNGGGMGGMSDTMTQTASSGSSVLLSAPFDLSSILVAIGIAVLAGVIAGAFGGWRASKLRPAEALRTL